MAVETTAEEQQRLLEEALLVVRQQFGLMRKCLDTPGKLMDALKCSSTLVAELRTAHLGPKQYYELYMAVFDALRHLAAYLRDAHPVNHLADLYELVQYAGNIVPRLYLMITVGTVYMNVADAPVKEIMKDMMEMSRGVQHPVRGLFLRYYLTGQTRDALPAGSEDGPQGNLHDSITFVLTNFVEMNKLWVRLQHQGHSRDRDQRTRERQELQLLVGSNLVRLSQLVDLDLYQSTILQPLLQQVVACRDVLAQEYLLEVITQVFPDDYHLHTLDQLLAAIAQLNPQVNVKAVIVGLMDRLSVHTMRDSEDASPDSRRKREADATARLLEKLEVTAREAPTNEQEAAQPPSKGQPILFEVFYEQVIKLVNAQRLQVHDMIALLVSLCKLALNNHPDRLDYVDKVLAFAGDKISEHANSTDLHSAQSQANILALLQAPIQTYQSLFTALSLPHLIRLFNVQSYTTRRAVAGDVVKSILRNQTMITTQKHLEKVLDIVSVLVKEGNPSFPRISAPRRGAEPDDVLVEQGWLARMIHYVNADDLTVQFQMLQLSRKTFSEGNERIKHTTPPLVTACLKLVRRYKAREHLDDNWSSQASTIYKFLHSTILALYTRNGAAELCLRLFVASGQVADQGGSEEIAYECFAQAFTIYEEAISDSRAQFQAVCIIASALHGSVHFGKENYDTLITKAALHGSKLLKKPDQCRAVYLASHLWWAVADEPDDTLYRDGKRVLECLQRALRVADACMDTSVSVELFVEILNRYVYYFDQQNETVTTKYINGLIELIHSNLQTNAESTSLEAPRQHFYRTLEYIRSREYDGVVTEAKH